MYSNANSITMRPLLKQPNQCNDTNTMKCPILNMDASKCIFCSYSMGYHANPSNMHNIYSINHMYSFVNNSTEANSETTGETNSETTSETNSEINSETTSETTSETNDKLNASSYLDMEKSYDMVNSVYHNSINANTTFFNTVLSSIKHKIYL